MCNLVIYLSLCLLQTVHLVLWAKFENWFRLVGRNKYSETYNQTTVEDGFSFKNWHHVIARTVNASLIIRREISVGEVPEIYVVKVHCHVVSMSRPNFLKNDQEYFLIPPSPFTKIIIGMSRYQDFPLPKATHSVKRLFTNIKVIQDTFQCLFSYRIGAAHFHSWVCTFVEI